MMVVHDQENIGTRPPTDENVRKTPKSKSKMIGMKSTQFGSPQSSPKKPLGNSNIINIPKSTPTKTLTNITQKTPTKSKVFMDFQSPEPNIETPSSELIPDTPSSDSESYFSSPESSSISMNTGTSVSAGSIIDSAGSCRKRLRQPMLSSSQSIPPVSRRNARERNRVKQVSLAFNLLRQHIPQANRKKKLSKVETLRYALDYIQCMRTLLSDSSSSQPSRSYNSPPPPPQQQQESQSYYQGDLVYTLSDKQTLGYQPNSQNLQFQNEQPIHNVCLDPQILNLPKTEDTYQTFLYTSPYGSQAPQAKSFHGVQMLTDTMIDGSLVPLVKTNALPADNIKAENDLELFDDLGWWQSSS